MKRNGDFSQCRGKAIKRKNGTGQGKTLGMFHILSYEMRTSLLKVARDGVYVTQKNDQIDFKKPREEKHRKEELLREHVMTKVSEEFIDNLYYH